MVSYSSRVYRVSSLQRFNKEVLVTYVAPACSFCPRLYQNVICPQVAIIRAYVQIQYREISFLKGHATRIFMDNTVSTSIFSFRLFAQS